MGFLSKYKQPIKTFLWGIAGIIVSLYMLAISSIKFIGYFLFILSILMFVLAIYQALKTKS